MPSKASVALASVTAATPALAVDMQIFNVSFSSILRASHGADGGSTSLQTLSRTWTPFSSRTSAIPTASARVIEASSYGAAMPAVSYTSSTNSHTAGQNPRHRKRDKQADNGEMTMYQDPVSEKLESISYWMKWNAKNELDKELDVQEATEFPGFFDPNIEAGLTLVPQCRNPWYRKHHRDDTCKDWVSSCVNPDTWEIRNAYNCNGFTEDPKSPRGKWVNRMCKYPKFRAKHSHQNWCEGWLMLDNLASCRDKAEFEKRPVECTRAMTREADIKHNSLDLDWINPTCDWDSYSEAWAADSMKCDAWHREQDRLRCRRPGLGYDDGDDCKFACLTDEKCPRRVEFTPRIKQLCQDDRYFNFDGHWGICKELLCRGKGEKPPVCSRHHPAEEEENMMQMLKEQDGW